jgi:hypothetical protein
MTLFIEIEVDDRAPVVEYCGEGCKCLNKGICHLFNAKLEDDSMNKIDDNKDGKIVFDETRTINGWKRCKQCIEIFYIFGKPKNK